MEQSGTKLKTPSRSASQDIPLILPSHMFRLRTQESTQLVPFPS